MSLIYPTMLLNSLIAYVVFRFMLSTFKMYRYFISKQCQFYVFFSIQIALFSCLIELTSINTFNAMINNNGDCEHCLVLDFCGNASRLCALSITLPLSRISVFYNVKNLSISVSMPSNFTRLCLQVESFRSVSSAIRIAGFKRSFMGLFLNYKLYIFSSLYFWFSLQIYLYIESALNIFYISVSLSFLLLSIIYFSFACFTIITILCFLQYSFFFMQTPIIMFITVNFCVLCPSPFLSVHISPPVLFIISMLSSCTLVLWSPFIGSWYFF